MSTTIPAQQPRRRVWRWVVALGLAALVLGSAWQVVMRNQAISELGVAGFVYGTGRNLWPAVRKDWRAIFNHRIRHAVPTVSQDDLAKGGQLRNFDNLAAPLRHLKVEDFSIVFCPHLQNVDALKDVHTLRIIHLSNCRALQNVAGLNGLTELQSISLQDCRALENVDALHGLIQLKHIDLSGCNKLSSEAVAALLAALPNTNIVGPDCQTISAH